MDIHFHFFWVNTCKPPPCPSAWFLGKLLCRPESVPVHVTKDQNRLFSHFILPTLWDLGNIVLIFPRKQKLRDISQPAQDHTAGTWIQIQIMKGATAAFLKPLVPLVGGEQLHNAGSNPCWRTVGRIPALLPLSSLSLPMWEGTRSDQSWILNALNSVMWTGCD